MRRVITWARDGEPEGFNVVFLDNGGDGVVLRRMVTRNEDDGWDERYAGFTYEILLPRSAEKLRKVAAALEEAATSIEMDQLTKGRPED